MTSISDLEETALPLDGYASLRDFFVRSLKEGCRPIDSDPQCLVTGNRFLDVFTGLIYFKCSSPSLLQNLYVLFLIVIVGQSC